MSKPDSEPLQRARASIPEYGWENQDNNNHHTISYLWPTVNALLPRSMGSGLRVLDIGCGDGYWAGELTARGCRVVGIDPSKQGIEAARQNHPNARFDCGEARADLLSILGEQPFDLVLSIEVIEHVYLPREWAAGCFHALKPGGKLICSTPYHGYLKNLLLSLTNRWDRHLSPLWDGGHIKMWSRNTLTTLLAEVGFVNIRFAGAGRVPLVWKSMVLTADRPPKPS